MFADFVNWVDNLNYLELCGFLANIFIIPQGIIYVAKLLNKIVTHYSSETIYNKLIRDKLEDVILADCKNATFAHVEGDEKRMMLKNKLIEEVKEFNDTLMMEELADVLEVIDAIIKEYRFDTEHLNGIKQVKREKKGGFDKGLVLISSVK